MRLPKLPARRDTPEQDERAVPAQAAQPGPAAGYRDLPGPNLPPPPLTTALLKSIRFTISEPQGYYFDQVETFVEQVTEALHYYEQAEFQWRQTVYEMQIEADQQAYDLQRVRSEIELFKVQGSPLVNPDGTYITESQQATNEALLADLSAANEALLETQQAIAARDAEVVRLQDVTSAQDQEIVSLRQWGQQMITDMQAAQAELVAAYAEIEALRAATSAPVAPADVAAPAVPEADEADEADEAAPVAPVVPAGEFPVVLVAPGVSAEESEFDGEDYDDETDDETEDEQDFGVGDDSDDLDEDYADYEDYDEVEEPDAEPGLADEPGEAAPTPVSDAEPDAEPDVAPNHDGSLTEEDHAAPVAAEQADTALAQTPEPEEAPSDEHVVAALDPDAPVDLSPTVPVTEPGQIADLDIPEEAPDGAEAVTEGYDPYSEYDEAADEEPGATVPVVPVDSELPEGIELPGTGEAAITYPPAAPGLPLDTRGVAVEVWAPELDPRLRAALAETEAASEPDAQPNPDEDADTVTG